MKYLFALLFAFIGLLFTNCSHKTGQFGVYKIFEDGGCYSKVKFPTTYGKDTQELIVYIGNDFDQEGIRIEEIEMSPFGTVWEKRKADPNCLSANPDDCMVWCLVEVAAVYDTLALVTDTSLVKDYLIENLITEFPIQKEKVTWAEIHCEHHISESLINSISTKLTELSYLSKPTSFVSENLKAAIKKYQKDHGLGHGALTKEFTEHLGL